MCARPKTITFTELHPDADVNDIEQLLSIRSAPAGRGEYRNGGRPTSRRKMQEVLYAIRAAYAAGNSLDRIAEVLGVPVEVVQGYIEEVMP